MHKFLSIKQQLNKTGIKFEEITFSDSAISARQKDTSLEGNYNPETAIKTLIVKTKKGFKAIILHGNDKIDSKKLKQVIGRWSIVDSNTLELEFGFKPGCICPLVLDLLFIIDTKATEMDIWSMGAGDIDKGINVETRKVLGNLKNFSIADISYSGAD